MPLESFPNDGLAELQALPEAPMQVRVGLLAAGRKKVGVFVKLKNSARNCSIIRSVMVVFLKTDTSAFLDPGPRATRRAGHAWHGAGDPEGGGIEVGVHACVIEHHWLSGYPIGNIERIEDGR